MTRAYKQTRSCICKVVLRCLTIVCSIPAIVIPMSIDMDAPLWPFQLVVSRPYQNLQENPNVDSRAHRLGGRGGPLVPNRPRLTLRATHCNARDRHHPRRPLYAGPRRHRWHPGCIYADCPRYAVGAAGWIRSFHCRCVRRFFPLLLRVLLISFATQSLLSCPLCFCHRCAPSESSRSEDSI